MKKFHYSNNWDGKSRSSCPFPASEHIEYDDGWAIFTAIDDVLIIWLEHWGKSDVVGCSRLDGEPVFSFFNVSLPTITTGHAFHWQFLQQWHKHMHRRTRKRQQRSPAHNKLGPISLSSGLRKPFSPVPIKEITRPSAVVPSPTYNTVFNAALISGWTYPLRLSFSSSSPLLP